MTSEVYKIVYCSRNLIHGKPAERDAEISQILQSARVNNRRQDVTGALLYNSEYFAQVLEGPSAAIHKVFEKIQRDPRHGEVTILETGKCDGRAFPDWSMAHVRPATEAESAGVTAAIDDALSHPDASAEGVLDLLRSLVIQND